MTLRSSSASLGHVESGESPLLPLSTHVVRGGPGRDGPARAPAWLGSGLSLVLLGDEASQLLPKITRRKVEKTFSLLPLDLQAVRDGGSSIICCGVVEEGSRFCSKLARDCVIRDHWSKKKMYDVMEMEDGFYINDVGVVRAFGEPCLLLVAASRSPTFQDLLNEGEGKSLKTWTTIFRHLCNRAKDAKAFMPVQGQWTADNAEDRGLANFYTALKTPWRVALDSLNSPKHIRYDDAEMDEGEGSPDPGATSC
jgi:hypothetical protein